MKELTTYIPVIIAGVELIARLKPTKRNYSIVDFVKKVADYLVKNKRK